MPVNNTHLMATPIPSTATTVSSSGLWDVLSNKSDLRRQTRIKDLETKMYYGSGFDPPVNNALVPNIFNKIDARCQERTRVINSVLDRRRDVQERVISRSLEVQERAHAKQTAKLREDLRKICKRLPSFAKLYKNTDIALLEKQVKKSPVQYSRANVSLPDEHHYCFRYFEHHNPVRIARRVAEGIKKDVKRLEQSMENKSTVRHEVLENNKSVHLAEETANDHVVSVELSLPGIVEETEINEPDIVLDTDTVEDAVLTPTSIKLEGKPVSPTLSPHQEWDGDSVSSNSSNSFR